MSSISASLSSTFRSPLQRLENRLDQAVSSGTIPSADKQALSSALQSIDQTLQSDRAGQGTGARPDGATLKARVEGLIEAQVKSGALTDNQAGELKQLFAQGGPGKGGPEGAGGLGGLLAGRPGSDPDGDGDTDGAGSSDKDMSSLIQDFLKLLQDSQGGVYGSNGTKTSGTLGALMVDTQA